MSQLILVTIIIAQFFTSPKILLYYDQIEYLKIVSTSSFISVFSMGHFPIHPIFLGIFWITSRIITPNLTAFIFGIMSLFLMSKISKIIFSKGKYIIPVLIFSFFPAVWIMNTNLMIQSVLLTFYLLSIYFFLTNKRLAFFASVFLMMGIHIDAIYWTTTIFILPIFFKDELNFKSVYVFKFIKTAVLLIICSLIYYAVIYIFIRNGFGNSTEQLLAYSSFGFLRIIRNIWFCFIFSFGSITPFILGYLIFKNTKTKLEIFGWLIFFFAISIGGAYWEGDLMMRRIVFAGVFLALYLYKHLQNKSILIILYLLPITFFAGILNYRNNQNIPLTLMQKNINLLPNHQDLIQSHYHHPFTKYDGKILWTEMGQLNQIDNYLKKGVRVFITKESLVSPYRLYTGNYFHITSLSKVGESDVKYLFTKYKVDPFLNSYEIKIPENPVIAKDAGTPIVNYSTGFWNRLNRERIDYGDLGAWLWALITNHKDPTGWTYKDIS